MVKEKRIDKEALMREIRVKMNRLSDDGREDMVGLRWELIAIWEMIHLFAEAIDFEKEDGE